MAIIFFPTRSDTPKAGTKPDSGTTNPPGTSKDPSLDNLGFSTENRIASLSLPRTRDSLKPPTPSRQNSLNTSEHFKPSLDQYFKDFFDNSQQIIFVEKFELALNKLIQGTQAEKKMAVTSISSEILKLRDQKVGLKLISNFNQLYCDVIRYCASHSQELCEHGLETLSAHGFANQAELKGLAGFIFIHDSQPRGIAVNNLENILNHVPLEAPENSARHESGFYALLKNKGNPAAVALEFITSLRAKGENPETICPELNALCLQLLKGNQQGLSSREEIAASRYSGAEVLIKTSDIPLESAIRRLSEKAARLIEASLDIESPIVKELASTALGRLGSSSAK